jgi:hypothetical protein
MATRIAINGFGRIGRCVTRVLFEAASRRTSRSSRSTTSPTPKTLAHLLKFDSVHRTASFSVEARRGRIIVRRQEDPDLRQEGPRGAPVEGPRRRHRPRVHRQVQATRRAARSTSSRRQAVIISAPGEKDIDGTFCVGINDEATTQAKHHRLERLVHHELPRADRQGRERHVRHREGPHGHGALVHQRPEHPRPAAQGSAPRARRSAVDDPLDDGRREGDRPRAPGAEGQARRHLDPRAHADVSLTMPDRRREQVRPRWTRSTPRSRPPRGPAEGHPRLRGAPLVSSDYIGNPQLDRSTRRRPRWSATTSSRCRAWYDNEWGFSHRMVDLAAHLAAARRRGARRCSSRDLDASATSTARVARVRARGLQRAARRQGRDRRHARARGDPHHRSSLLEKGARVVIASHLGRPKGGPGSQVLDGARRPEARGADEHRGDAHRGLHRRRPKKVVGDLRDGQIACLENLRFHPEEEKNDEAFARELAKLCDVLRQRRVRRGAPRARLGRRPAPLHRERAAGLLLEAELASLGRVRR